MRSKVPHQKINLINKNLFKPTNIKKVNKGGQKWQQKDIALNVRNKLKFRIQKNQQLREAQKSQRENALIVV